MVAIPVRGRVKIASEGILGDHQADRRVHGGPEKAIHHYAATNYSNLAARFPEIAAAFVPGSIGENISASGIDEHTVAIGDIFTLIPPSDPLRENGHFALGAYWR